MECCGPSVHPPAQVCGVGCSEVDLMEANTRAFLSTAHTLEPEC